MHLASCRIPPHRQTGYTFDAVATDAGDPGKGRDRFALTIRDAANHIVATVNALLTGGNIDNK